MCYTPSQKNTNTYIKQNRLIWTSAYKKLTQFQYATLNFQNTFMLSKVLFVTLCRVAAAEYKINACDRQFTQIHDSKHTLMHNTTSYSTESCSMQKY